jgi:hypothetical protein
MKTFALIVLLLLHSLLFAQVDFQVRSLEFVQADSIIDMVDHPNGNEVLPLFANEAGSGYLQRGMLRERGDRVEFPPGERFFCMDGPELVTESYNQSRKKASVQALRLRRYRLNKSRLSKLDELVDSLRAGVAPPWRRWGSDILVHPACQNVHLYQGNVLLASQRQGLVNVQAFAQSNRLPVFNTMLPAKPGMKLSGEPWIKPLIASPDVWLIQSWWQYGVSKPEAWLTAMDSTGMVLWEKKAKGKLVNHFHPLGLVLSLRENSLFGQQLDAIDSRTGQTLWTSPLFDIYSNDTLLSWSAPSPASVRIVDIAPVLGGAYTAIFIAQAHGKKPLLVLLDDQGKPVYRYALREPTQLGHLQDRDAGFALVTEHESLMFRPR